MLECLRHAVFVFCLILGGWIRKVLGGRANIPFGRLIVRQTSGKQSVRHSVSLDEDEHKANKDMADATDLSTAWVVCHAVSGFLEWNGKDNDLPFQDEDGQAA